MTTTTAPVHVRGERTFGRDEIIVSKTDLKGRLTYANDVFLRVSAYSEEEVLGQPHSLIRHPETPRGLFHVLWETIQGGQEIFAYINNLAKDGANYWVLAHVTPSRAANGSIVAYHSNRRLPARAAITRIEELYASMRAAEAGHRRTVDAAAASRRVLEESLGGRSYDEFIWELITETDR